MTRAPIASGIRRYQSAFLKGEHARDRSWEHCYRFFQEGGPRAAKRNPQDAALNLGFYLASWGMYRGSSFLLQHAYTVHVPVVERLVQARYASLWRDEVGSGERDEALIPIAMELAHGIREAYSEFGFATDTLVTKVMLGVLGCVPACDQYFIKGCRREGIPHSSFNATFLARLGAFSKYNLRSLRREQVRLKGDRGVRYPLMKLVDMYFWQVGFSERRAVTP